MDLITVPRESSKEHHNVKQQRLNKSKCQSIEQMKWPTGCNGLFSFAKQIIQFDLEALKCSLVGVHMGKLGVQPQPDALLNTED